MVLFWSKKCVLFLRSRLRRLRSDFPDCVRKSCCKKKPRFPPRDTYPNHHATRTPSHATAHRCSTKLPRTPGRKNDRSNIQAATFSPARAQRRPHGLRGQPSQIKGGHWFATYIWPVFISVGRGGAGRSASWCDAQRWAAAAQRSAAHRGLWRRSAIQPWLGV